MATKFVLTQKPNEGEYKALTHINFTRILTYMLGGSQVVTKTQSLVSDYHLSFPGHT